MSKDLQKSFPDMSGFSVQNLKSIRYWYKFYNSEENGLQPVSQMELIENMVKAFLGDITSESCISATAYRRHCFMYRKQWITAGAGTYWNIK